MTNIKKYSAIAAAKPQELHSAHKMLAAEQQAFCVFIYLYKTQIFFFPK